MIQRMAPLGCALLFLLHGVSAAEIQHISFPDSRVKVEGLAWFSEDTPTLRRLPARLQKEVRPVVWELAQHTSGARLRFRTTSSKIGISAQVPDISVMHHFTSVAQNGLDLYRDGEYLNSAWPGPEGKIGVDWASSSDGLEHDYTIYLPLYKGIKIQELRIDGGSLLAPATPYAVSDPVVYYGSSITQGGCASNAGLSYQAIVSRDLNLDFVNLGMSGHGLGESEMARAVAEIKASAFVLDFWANPSFDIYQKNLGPFVDTLRSKHPKIPILVISPFWFAWELNGKPGAPSDQQSKRDLTKKFVMERKTQGDSQIFFVDGLELLSRKQAAGLVDGVHPNSLGFHYIATGLQPHLRKALPYSDFRSRKN